MRTTISIGHESYVIAEHVDAVIPYGSVPSRRLVQQKTEKQQMVDAAAGKAKRSLVVMKSGTVLASAIKPDAIQRRLSKEHADG